MIEIPLSQEYTALIDDEDYELVSQYKWNAQISRNTYYAIANIKIENKHTTIKMHRLIMNAPKGKEVDHKNNNGLDNQRENLRLCTTAQNQYNQHSNRGSSKYKGVWWGENINKWRAGISVNKKTVCLGSFLTEEEAALSYNKAAIKYYEDFAGLNIVEDK